MTEETAYIDILFAKAFGKGDEPLFETLLRLMHDSRKGSLCIETSEMKETLTTGEKSPLVLYENSLYLRRNWELETTIIKELKRLLQRSPSLPPLKKPKESLYPAQEKAYHLLEKSPLLFISGGPGSGKTFFAKTAIEALLKENPKAHIIFTAPTAKAASRITDSRVLSKTLHSLLDIRTTIDLTKPPLPITADLIIIDECSMIDTGILSLLLSAISLHTHVLLMGDPNQLPPIESGGLFEDLLNLPAIPHVHFNETKRTDLIGLQTLYTLIREDKVEEALTLLKSGTYPEITFSESMPPIHTLQKEGSIILTPFNKGPFGTEEINAKFSTLRPFAQKPIIITKNDYRLGLSNGDIGWLEKETAFFVQKNGIKSYPSHILLSYDLAFALSIHKSQGSEFDHLFLLLPEGSEIFGKEMLYTALTRAKKSVSLFASQEILRKILHTKTKSQNNLQKRFAS